MIKGLRLKLPSAEVAEHCNQRAAYHAKREREKIAELPGLKDALEKIKGAGGLAAQSVATMSKGGYHLNEDSPVAQLESDIRDHHNKSLLFAFIATHLFDEDYDLDESDLRRLEILKS